MPKVKAKDLQLAADVGRFNKKDRVVSFPLRMTESQWSVVKNARHLVRANSLNGYIKGRLGVTDSTAGRMRDEDAIHAPSAMSTERSYNQSKARTATIAGRNK